MDTNKIVTDASAACCCFVPIGNFDGSSFLTPVLASLAKHLVQQ